MIKKIRNRLRLNVKPLEAAIRVLLAFALTFFLVIFHSLLAIILICGIATYLLITSLLLFCPVKHLLQHSAGKERESTSEKEMPFRDL